MKGNVLIVVVLLRYSILVNSQVENSTTEIPTPKNISGRLGWDEETANNQKAAIYGISAEGDKPCDEWDYGDGFTGELCNFRYDLFGCMKFMPNDTILKHKGTKEFGQKCNNTGGEDACILLSPKTLWDFREFDEPSMATLNANCRRRTFLACDDRYKKCICATKDIPGEWYQYDAEDKTCYIRPGFPCINDYDCGKKTRCERIFIADDDEDEDPHWEPICNCDYAYDLGPEDIDTSDWNNWQCGLVFATKKRGLLPAPKKFELTWETYKKGDNKITNTGGCIGLEVSYLLYNLYVLFSKVLIWGKVDLD